MICELRFLIHYRSDTHSDTRKFCSETTRSRFIFGAEIIVFCFEKASKFYFNNKRLRYLLLRSRPPPHLVAIDTIYMYDDLMNYKDFLNS